MFNGWLRYGSVELVNLERLDAYVKAGCSPPAADVDVSDEVCEGLGAALQEGPYTMPAIDQPPWFDAAQPETHWFAGVVPLDVTGLDGSTLTADVSERLGDGGQVVNTRHTSRTVAVSALLVGRDDPAVHAGLEWLTQVLHRTCNPAPADCGGTTLEAFTTCPAPVLDAEDTSVDPIDHPADPDDTWLAFGGRWEGGIETFLTNESAEPGVPELVFIGGTATVTGELVLWGGNASTDQWTVEYLGGTATPLTRVGRLGSPDALPCLSEAVATWLVDPLDDTVRVAVGAIDADGNLLAREPFVELGGDPTTLVYTARAVSWPEWYPALWVSEPGAVVSLTVSYRPDVDPDDQLTPYHRIYQDVTCVAGPTVVAEHMIEPGATLLQVEWTWVCGDAYRYQLPVQLLTGFRTDGTAPAPVLAEGVSTILAGTIDASLTACDAPVAVSTCVDDPLYPTWSSPPAAPRITDPAAPAPQTYNRAVAALEPLVVPTAGVGALRLTLANGATIKRGIRVRVWEAEIADFDSVPECGFAYEFTVRFLDSDVVLAVDGPAGTITAVCVDGSLVNASGSVRGAYGGAFEFPELSCDRRYFIAVDVPTGQGRVDWGASLSLREG